MKGKNAPQKQPRGTLIIIGGKENKDGDCTILTEVASAARGAQKHLVIMTVATQKPEEVRNEYTHLFHSLGVKNVDALDIRVREDAHHPDRVEMIKKASVVFFTGGDQLRITSQIGDSPVFQCLQERFRRGATIVGTSAGASAMSETMLIGGDGDKSLELDGLKMAPGLGLLKGVVIDSHFAERGRVSRLLSAVAQNPANIGLGIDEDTAIVVEPDRKFRVVGSGAVYVVDGTEITYSNLSEDKSDAVLTLFDSKLHVLACEARFDLNQRRPMLDGSIQTEVR